MKDYITGIWRSLQGIAAAAGGWIGFLLGETDGMLTALYVLIVLDYITGIICAIIDHRLSSRIGLIGICKKVLILIMVGVGNILDIHVIGSGGTLRGIVIAFYLSNEGLSVIENAAHAGLPVPEKVKQVLEQLHNREEKEK